MVRTGYTHQMGFCMIKQKVAEEKSQGLSLICKARRRIVLQIVFLLNMSSVGI